MDQDEKLLVSCRHSIARMYDRLSPIHADMCECKGNELI